MCVCCSADVSNKALSRLTQQNLTCGANVKLWSHTYTKIYAHMQLFCINRRLSGENIMLPGLRFTRRPLFPLGIKKVIYGLFVGTRFWRTSQWKWQCRFSHHLRQHALFIWIFLFQWQQQATTELHNIMNQKPQPQFNVWVMCDSCFNPHQRVTHATLHWRKSE